MKKLKKIVLYFFGFLVLLGVGITLFINLYPSLGGNPSKAQKEIYNQFDNYVNEKFVNEVPTVSSDSESMNKDAIAETTDCNPTGEISVSVIDWNKIKSEKDSQLKGQKK